MRASQAEPWLRLGNKIAMSLSHRSKLLTIFPEPWLKIWAQAQAKAKAQAQVQAQAQAQGSGVQWLKKWNTRSEPLSSQEQRRKGREAMGSCAPDPVPSITHVTTP